MLVNYGSLILKTRQTNWKKYKIKHRALFLKLKDKWALRSWGKILTLNPSKNVGKMRDFCFLLNALNWSIEPGFQYNLEKGWGTRQWSNTYTPFIRTNTCELIVLLWFFFELRREILYSHIIIHLQCSLDGKNI